MCVQRIFYLDDSFEGLRHIALEVLHNSVNETITLSGKREITSKSSTPTLMRTILGSAPASELERCSINDSTPPKLVAGYMSKKD